MRIAGSVALSVAVVASASLAGTDERDFYGASRYPGPKLRKDVELPTVKEIKASRGELARREVTFWPRKGVDFTPVEANMPVMSMRKLEATERTVSPPWARRLGHREAGLDPKVREEYWDNLGTFNGNVRAGMLLVFVRGYLTPPAGGKYTFYVAGDDQGAFMLSSDDKPGNMELLCFNREYTRPQQYFQRGASQTSRAMELEAGKKYYFDAIFRDFGGRATFSVAWKYEGRQFPEIIDGKYLETLDGRKGLAKAHYYEAILVQKGNKNRYAVDDTQAHLLGFRGVGYSSVHLPKDKQFGEKIPAPVVRLPDGRKRRARGFDEKSRELVKQAYRKAQKRIQDSIDKTPHVSRVDTSENVEPGQIGVNHQETQHVCWFAGSQGGAWNDPKRGFETREGIKAWSENMFQLYEYVGYPLWTWRAPKQIKYRVTVAGTTVNGNFMGGFAGGGRGACIASGGSYGILSHEFGHGSGAGFGGEGDADAHAGFASGGMKGGRYVATTATYRNLYGANIKAAYGQSALPALFGDDPNWGNGFFFAIPYGAEEPTIAHIMSRLIEQRGMVRKGEGIRGWGDFVGEFAARVFTYDYELEDELQRRCHTMHMSPMERIDPDKPLYRIHSDYEPEPFGINYVRLDADPKAREITVDFRGMQDPDIHSDWRACIIAVENDGKRRYTPLWNAGRMSMAVGPDDSAHFLSVAATPTALPKDNYSTGFSHSTLTVGQYAPKYPWEAEITGAVPGAPVKRLGDVGYVETGHQGVLYAPRRATAEVLARFQEHYAKIREQAAMIPKTQDEACDRFAAVLNLTTYKTAIDMMAPGRPHPNGGGWVSDSAKVAETAYVGPNAMVIGQSEVSDNAIIEGNAIVIGNSRITGNAKVSDGVVIDSETLDGFSRKWRPGKMHHELPRRWTTMKGLSDHNVERLWVNYAMNGEGGIRLNDYYYMAGPADQFLQFRETGPQLHGFVSGKPEYVKVDGKWGMRIENASQYAMLNPRAADLGEITLALTLRRETASAGTVLDLGVDTDNAMVLTLRKSGTPRFVATSGGKDVVKLSGKTKIPLNQWASVRVELDGKTASLFVDGKKEASTGTTFRASDVYLPDAVRRNYLGNSRTRKSPFIGVLDELVIYYTVHPDFADLMPPVVHCPYRPTEGALEAVEAYAKAYDAYMSKKKAAEDAKKKADEAAKKEAAEPSDAPETTVLAVRPTNSTLEEKQKYYADLKKRMSQRMGELDAAHPQMAELVSEIDRLNKEIRDQTSKAKREFHETPYAKKIEAERLAAHKRMNKVNREDHALFNEFKESRPEFQAEMQVIHEQPVCRLRQEQLPAFREDACERWLARLPGHPPLVLIGTGHSVTTACIGAPLVYHVVEPK